MKILDALDEVCHHAEYIKNYSENTTDRYRSVVKNFKKNSGLEQVEEITEKTVKKFFLNGRRERDWSPETFITYKDTLTVFLRWCVDEGYLDENYAENIETPKTEKQLPKSLSREEAETILDYVYNFTYVHNVNFLKHRNKAIMATFIFAGLRRSELLGLRNGDVDLKNKSIFVNQGKGGKDRYVPIVDRLADILREYKAARRKKGKSCPKFFASCFDDMGYTNSGLSRLINRIREESDIYFTPHMLRHTFATQMLEGGCDIYSLSKMLGHNKIKTTTIYLAASSKHLEGEIDKHPLN